MSGDGNAKTNAIGRIFNKEEYDGVSNTIDYLVGKLQDNPNDETILQQISTQCKIAEEDLAAVGLTVDDAVNYFTQLGEVTLFNTEKGKKEEIETATEAMTKLLDGLQSGSIDTSTLFDEEGKIIQTKLAEMFKGTSPETRAAITQLLEDSYNQIENGLNDSQIDLLMARFEGKMSD